MFLNEMVNSTYKRGGSFMYSFDEVKNADPEIAQAILDEQERQNSHIELIASENLSVKR